MNIFILDTNPLTAAEHLCDKHVVKMSVETAQMMASALRRHGATDIDMPLTKSGKPYKGGYPNHPCTLWAGYCRCNYRWLAYHGLSLCSEYTYRYDKVHSCQQAIKHMLSFSNYIPTRGYSRNTPFALAMPDEFKHKNAVKAYRNYYVGEKADIAKWNKGRSAPRWFTRMKGAACA